MYLQKIFVLAFAIIHGVIDASVSEMTIFEEMPMSTQAILHSPALLRCITISPVHMCRWSWRPLDRPKSNLITVKEFESFGNESRDCSVRFRSVHAEQEGEWTCGVLPSGSSQFINAPGAAVRVLLRAGIDFIEQPQRTEMFSGQGVVLRCVAGGDVEYCRWTWRPLNQLNSLRLTIKEFAPFGNVSRDCSVRFRSALPEQTGEWTCGVRLPGQLNYHTTSPATLIVRLKEIKFIQLSQDLQVAEGEPVLLRCIAASEVTRCRWTWRPMGGSRQFPGFTVKEFAAFGKENRDCSVRFRSVLPEQAGEWTCGVQPIGEPSFQDAPPARLGLLPAAKVRFVDVPKDVRVNGGATVTLPCSVTTNVSVCRWNWKPLEPFAEAPLHPIEFPARGNWSRDCSLELKNVDSLHQGLWTCSVLGPPANSYYMSPSAKLTVHHPVDMKFMELSRDIQMLTGSPLLLRCIAASKVSRCRWTWRPLSGGAEVQGLTVKEFAAFGNESRDCSVRFRSVLPEQAGEWTCGVQPIGESAFQDAPPARLSVLWQEEEGNNNNNTLTAAGLRAHSFDWSNNLGLLREWPPTSNSNKVSSRRVVDKFVTLVCRLGQPFFSCSWTSPSGVVLVSDTEFTSLEPQAADSRFSVVAERATGVCSLIFALDHSDLGQWRCVFNLNSSIQGEPQEVEGSTFLTLTNHQSNPSNTTLLWTIIVLFGMMLVLVVIVVIFTYRYSRKSSCPDNTTSCSQMNSLPPRYSDHPCRIDFQFSSENDVKKSSPSSPDSVFNSQSEEPTYEKVQNGTYLKPRTSKSIYQNLS